MPPAADDASTTGLQPNQPQHADPGQPIPAEPAHPEPTGLDPAASSEAPAEPELPEEPLVPVVNKLDRNLVGDLAGQLGDIKRSLDAMLEQNLQEDVAHHVEKAKAHLDDVAVELNAAVESEQE